MPSQAASPWLARLADDYACSRTGAALFSGFVGMQVPSTVIARNKAAILRLWVGQELGHLLFNMDQRPPSSNVVGSFASTYLANCWRPTWCFSRY